MVIEAVAIDGPVASGKTTIGLRVAERLDYGFLDTGLMYRAATLQAMRSGISVDDWSRLTRMASSMRIGMTRSARGERLTVDDEDVTDHLKTIEVDRGVSAVSAVPGVRRALVPLQRRIAEMRPFVMVGRDIGTVVIEDARTKIYLDASATVRARRRHAEMTSAGMLIEVEQVLDDIVRRDNMDAEREYSPFRPAKDAVIIHTDDLDIPETVDRILQMVDRS